MRLSFLRQPFHRVYLEAAVESKSEKVTYPPVLEVAKSEKRPPEPRKRGFEGEMRDFRAIYGFPRAFWALCRSEGSKSQGQCSG